MVLIRHMTRMRHITKRWRHGMRPMVRRAWGMYHSLHFPPAVICAAILALTALGWISTRHGLQHDINVAEDTRITATEHLVESQLNSYEEILSGGVGLFQGSDEVTRSDWQHYIAAFNVTQDYPGAQAFGYARVTTSDELPDLTAYMQAQGVADFAIQPSSPARDVYAPVVYTQPERPGVMFGFDMLSEPTRRMAVLEARDTNRAIITQPITLMAKTSQKNLTGFNMYVPYYDIAQPIQTTAQRQAAIKGYVFASFRANIFFKNIVASDQAKTMGLSIRAGATPLYASGNYASLIKQHGILQVTRPLQVYGQTWTITYAFNRHGLVSQPQLNRPAGVLFAGIFMAIMVPLIVWLLLRARSSELLMQKERDIELAKDELLSLASHQLRTPATGVKQYLGMVLQGFLGPVVPEQHLILEKAYASNDRQLHVINEILHLAKIDAGRIVLARQNTNLRDLLHDIMHEQQSDLKNAGHKLTTHIPKQPIMLNVDAHMLRMAFENLLSNAIKYTHRGGKITITVRQTATEVHISIQDTGVGIAQEDFPKLFKQFSRLPNEMSQQVGGTGVGLYLAKHLIELHGGSIRVTSSLGHGTTFSVTLPKNAA